jgi:excisionase family DNA binding protein
MGELPKALTPPEVAKLEKVSDDKVRLWISNGELKAHNAAADRKKRPLWRIDPADLAAFRAARSATPTPSQPTRNRRQKPSSVREFF